MHPNPTDSTQRQLLRSLSSFSIRLKFVERQSFLGMSGRQLLLLASLCSFDHSPTLTELSEANGASHQNIKQILLKLEKSGHIKLLAHETDSRALLVEPTEKGLEFSELYEAKMDQFVAQLFDTIPEEDVETCQRVVEHLREGLNELL
ncbi:MarR family winged helix-turn-helix transcriptional regulator [Raoultibacter phocaeensis]|uniref:MarR family winged helix-turn-helix transcriptional regulator n=1 Tax=Raoultibacter phocaeensis TaxID=2479841 RepID=UPI001118BFDD|nr:MarR family transcriptional regulator [Raoultibacter phocaeensis]